MMAMDRDLDLHLEWEMSSDTSILEMSLFFPFEISDCSHPTTSTVALQDNANKIPA